MSDLTAVTTASAHPVGWAWPWSPVELAVWAAIGAGHLDADTWAVEVATWADTDPRVILEALGGAGLAQQPADVLLAGAWAGLARYATACRDDAVRACAGRGLSLRQVGDAVGLTHAGVARIVART